MEQAGLEQPTPTSENTATEGFSEFQGNHSLLLIGENRWLNTSILCGQLLNTPDLSDTHLVMVSFNQTPEERVKHCQAHLGELPNSLSVIIAGSHGEPTDSLPEGVSTERVQNVTDFARLGITISKHIESTAKHTVLCFDDLGGFLHYGELSRVYRFLKTLNDFLEKVDGIAHFHLSPSTVDEETLNTLRPLFDAVLEVDQDANLGVQ